VLAADRVRSTLQDVNPEAILWDGLDAAIIGCGGAFSQFVVVYSLKGIIAALMTNNTWDRDTAYEWYEFNVKGGYLGPHTPIVLEDDY
jgi:hypothetical protein